MKIIKIVTISLAFICSNQSFGQTYEVIYEIASSEVQSKMNENKIQGAEILNDINAHFQIGLAGILANEKSSFTQLLDAESRITEYTLSEDNTSISINSSADFSIENFTQILSTTSGVITGSSAVYSVNQ